MKIIKSFCMIIVCLCATTLLHAQDITAKTSKPAESTIPPPGSRPVTAPSSLAKDEKKTQGGELKPADTKNQSPSSVNEDDAKPKIVPAKNTALVSSSTLAVDIPNTILPRPITPNMSSTITTTAPATNETKKPTPVIAGQQKQN